METVPFEVFLLIVPYFDHKSYFRLSQASKKLHSLTKSSKALQSLFDARFPANLLKDRTDTEAVINQYVMQHTKSLLAAPSDLHVIWSDRPEYWATEPDDSSTFGVVSHLRLVWWFDVKAKFVGVPSGVYRPILRYKTGRNISGLNGVRIRVFVLDDGQESTEGLSDTEASLVSGIRLRPNATSWTDLVLGTEPLAIRATGFAYHTVWVEMVDHGPQPKSNLWIDSIELVPADALGERHIVDEPSSFFGIPSFSGRTPMIQPQIVIQSQLRGPRPTGVILADTRSDANETNNESHSIIGTVRRWFGI